MRIESINNLYKELFSTYNLNIKSLKMYIQEIVSIL